MRKDRRQSRTVSELGQIWWYGHSRHVRTPFAGDGLKSRERILAAVEVTSVLTTLMSASVGSIVPRPPVSRK